MSVMPLRHTPELPPGAEHENIPVTPVSKQPRGRSTIEFPYADLDDGVAIARAIFDKGGVPLEKDQLAAAVGQPVTSGAFVAKVHAARLFGLIDYVQGRSKLTDLGFQAVDRDESRARKARVKAFLSVPLFARTYEEFRNKQLPPRNEGLEHAFVGFGVLETRKHNARWAFDRSARQAGFFDNGEDRLVEPIIAEGNSNGTSVFEIKDKAGVQQRVVAKMPSPGAEELLIRGLLDRIPAPEDGWSLTERARWLRTLSVNLAMLYGATDEAEIQITVPPTPNPKPGNLAFVPAKTPPASTVVPMPPEPPRLPEPPRPPKPPEREDHTATPAKRNVPSWDAPPSGDLDDEIPF